MYFIVLSLGVYVHSNNYNFLRFNYLRWYFGSISRAKAVDYLGFEANSSGAFLIRECQRKDSTYALSMKAKGGHHDQHTYVYKHYLIQQNENKTQFWIKGAER